MDTSSSFDPVELPIACTLGPDEECCSFVDWTVIEADGHPVLRVLAKPHSPDGIDAIVAVFGAS